ncbi:MAG: nucleotidyltransferase [bacterium]
MLLDDVYKKIVSFLNKNGYNYLVIGGIAVGVLGEARFTEDVDLCLFIKKKDVLDFLKKAHEEGFSFNKERIKAQMKIAGVFQISIEDFHIDFIIASTDFEKTALTRRSLITLHSVSGYFPTPEDMIIFKVIPNRPGDIIDAEGIVIRHKGKLDEKYLISWAQKLSDEAENMRIYNEVKRLLNL